MLLDGLVNFAQSACRSRYVERRLPEGRPQKEQFPAHPKDPIIRNWGLVPELVLFGCLEHEHENQP